ncbi:uncharacterized protein N7484_010642 [Penicillium longicatenatum]|uniref:uncharacterized protein n=1 Tax=Penicillium longicatenatum TaxID=1561947 RepID=UPI002546B38E|nr:uncharacterized protein N7484_010642 [Penicillium longicatenatum]KAJ5630542.1 hypothetical protein N7484_010642 [Penicillium longicatenatum]
MVVWRGVETWQRAEPGTRSRDAYPPRLRNHKGGEDEYVQACLRECKAEIKLQDIDKKATALLKLIYLEMFGYDMSWASFHVLEVMSSTKYLQKRVGYLGAVQSFRPDTEVLMLATNMLKKDIVSPNILTLSLPLATLPHIMTPALAMSLLPDILSRLSHSSAVVRKKSIVCLYRLALVYPDALRLAWPKIQDHLMDGQEDSSVTTAAINVVCELGWRRPHDFLPLAPRFFELLVDSGNNWMAIKIIKLFATLTPLEPRLTRKLLRPLTNIIQTTTAMSLLYECINGIIQGGILDGEDNIHERDEVAALCIGKLRGMIVMDSDPNLKYVALLALNRIVTTHSTLVSMQQDVIMDCLDDLDVSIRLQALELAAGMVTSENLQEVVNRLFSQLQLASSQDNPGPGEASVPYEDEHENWKGSHGVMEALNMPNNYRSEVIHRILDICSQNNYSDVVDFEWYVGILVQLIRLLPPSEVHDYGPDHPSMGGQEGWRASVAGVRLEATRAAESLLLIDNRSMLFPASSNVGDDVLGPVAWVVGEYAGHLQSPSRTLQSLIDSSTLSLPPSTLQLFLQATPKVLIQVNQSCGTKEAWRSEISLLLARVVDFLDALAAHPDLDVQERAIEFLEVLRLGAESLQSETEGVPFLLASVIPDLFAGLELNPVAASAQKRVVFPPDLHLDEAFNDDLPGLFQELGGSLAETTQHHLIQQFYHVADISPPSHKPPHEQMTAAEIQLDASYQSSLGIALDHPDTIERRKGYRKERYRDDPFYIAPLDPSWGTSTPHHDAPHVSSGDALDIDSIPIVDLKLDDESIRRGKRDTFGNRRVHTTAKMEVAADETFGSEGPVPLGHSAKAVVGPAVKRSLLQVDSSGLGHSASGANDGPSPSLTGGEEETEMRKAMQNVEQMRLRMQRASERIELEGTPAEGTLVKKKKKKGKKGADPSGETKRKKRKEAYE